MDSVPLLRLPPQLQQSIVRQSYTKGQILVQQGEPARYLFQVEAGRLRLVSFVDQQMITHYFVEASELFGESALYFDTYGCTAIAEIPSTVIAIPKDDFAGALQQSTELSQRYLATLTHRFQSVKSLLELRSVRSARNRLLHYLMQRLPDDQMTLTIEKPLKAIASELALTPEALSRLLSRLEAEGVITRRKRSISFNPEWLETVFE